MNTECVCCETELKPKDSKNKNCQFCGSLACPKCIYKKKKFLSEKDKVPESQPGDICKICDRKMMLYQYFRGEKA